jgi:uncharacterized membrane protein YtjA (UPF0391 family)
MLNWIITFFILAIIAALCGFGGLAGTFASVAQFLTGLFVLLFVLTIIYSLVTGRRPPMPPMV